MSGDLVATLETLLPATLPVAAGTAVFCYGRCYHARDAVTDLAIVVDGARHRPSAVGMPRPDTPEAPQSGYWATIPIPPGETPGTIELALAARTAGGAEHVVTIGRIAVVPREPPPALGRPAPPGLIAVCMATYEPDPELLRAQVDSLRAQTDGRWVCVISDDASSPEGLAQVEAAIAGDDRFTLSHSVERIGFYGNFERALRMAPAEAELIALCDQDDRWHPDKLATLRAALGSAVLAYSDQRLVDADGRVLRDTLWKGRRNNHTDLASMLVANTITGAATLFRREVAELALPFPDPPGMKFHDHWLAVVALAAGDIAYVDRPLYDYVQHAGAVFGDVTQGGRRPRESPREAARGAYFLGYVARAVMAQALLVRCGARLTAAKRRALARFLAAERSPAAFLWLTARSLRSLAGRNETLGSELELAQGIAWRHLRPADATLPGLLSYEQRRLRRWRARV